MNRVIREIIDMIFISLILFLVPKLSVPTFLKTIVLIPGIFALIVSGIVIIKELLFKER